MKGNEFKIRASAIGEIMSNPRAKKDKLSATTKAYCQKWLKEQIYGRQEFNGNKYTEKGLQMEDEAIDYLSAIEGQFYLKNESKFQDKFITGTPDIIAGDTIIDIKCSWDEWTFPLFEDEIPTEGYYYQLQAYMYLTKRKKAKLVYCLMDTPEDLVNMWTDVPCSYEGLDSKYRIKTFDVEYDEAVIKQIIERVKECREYINELNEKLDK